MRQNHVQSSRTGVLTAVGRGFRAVFRFIARMLGRVFGMVLCITLAFTLMRTVVPELLREALGFNRVQEVTDTVIREDLTAIGELATYEFAYVNHVDFVNQPQLLGHDVLLTDHWFAFDYHGVIKAGFDVEKIGILWIDSVDCTVGIHLPGVSVLSNEIYIDMSTYEDRNNLCNPLQPREVLDYLYARKEPELNKALALGLLQKARESAEHLISAIIEARGYSAVFVD